MPLVEEAEPEAFVPPLGTQCLLVLGIPLLLEQGAREVLLVARTLVETVGTLYLTRLPQQVEEVAVQTPQTDVQEALAVEEELTQETLRELVQEDKVTTEVLVVSLLVLLAQEAVEALVL